MKFRLLPLILLTASFSSGCTPVEPWQKEILAKQAGTSLEVLEGVRKAGYAVSHSEREAGVFAVSAPIFNDKKRVVAALSMSGPTSRLTRELEIKYIKAVCQTAKQLSKELGYS